jgi:hypothetical protein
MTIHEICIIPIRFHMLKYTFINKDPPCHQASPLFQGGNNDEIDSAHFPK